MEPREKSLKIDLQRLNECLLKIEETYDTKLGVRYNFGPEFNDGFKHALKYIRAYVLPSLEIEETAKEINALEELQNELDILYGIIEDLHKKISELE